METSTDPRDRKAQDTPENIAAELNRRGHVVTSWEQLGQVWMEETGIETTQYRIGLPTEDSSPTVFKSTFPLIAESKLIPMLATTRKSFFREARRLAGNGSTKVI